MTAPVGGFDFGVLWLFLALALILFGVRRLLDRWSGGGGGAKETAEALLREVLSEAEYQHLERLGYLALPSPGVPGRTYRIPSRPGMVAVYQSGKLVEKLCLQPVDRLPAADVVLMLKLMIEGNEEEYLRTANVQAVEDAVVWPRGGLP